MRPALFLAAGLLAPVLLSAQADPRPPAAPLAIILAVEGPEIEVRREGGLSRQDSGLTGAALMAGDDVIVGEGSSLEIQPIASLRVIRVEGEANFLLESGAGEELILVYGNLRARFPASTAPGGLQVRGGGLMLEARGSAAGLDFGLSVQVLGHGDSAETLTRAFCLEGSVEVESQDEGLREQAPAKASLSAGEMASIRRPGGGRNLEKGPLDPDLQGYWLGHPFRGSPLPLEAFSSPLSPEEGSFTNRLVWDMERRRKAFLGAGGGLLAAGFLLEAVGGIALAEGHRVAGMEADNWDAAGVAIVSSGIFLLVGSLACFDRASRINRDIRVLVSGKD